MSTTLIKRALIVAAMFAIVCALVVVPFSNGVSNKAQAVTGIKNFTILHTNDEHSDIYPYALSKDFFTNPANPSTGGFSRLATTIGTIKAQKAAVSEPVLTLGAGDWSQGTLFSWLETGAAPELSLMQMMGYDAVTLGNHDVELGPQYLAAELNAAATGAGGVAVNLPILSSNIQFTADPTKADWTLYNNFWSATDVQRASLKIQPYYTKTLSNGLKVGMFGMLGVEAEAVAPGAAPLKFGNTTPLDQQQSFANRINVAKNTVATLRAAGCDVVVCLSHSGTAEDVQLADFVPGIDVIVGGHSHELDYPPIVRFPGGTIIVQAKADSEYLGDLELQYDPAPVSGRKVTVRNGTAIHMDQTVATNPTINAVVSNYLAAINSHLVPPSFPPSFNCMNPFAETDLYGDGGFALPSEPEMSETQMGNLIADSYRGVMNQVDPTHPTQIALEANGAIRDGIAKGASGIFSFYDLYRPIPLGGSPYDSPQVPGYSLCGFYLAGAEIQGMLNQLLDMNNNTFFVQISGLKYTYDPNGPTGNKVKSITVDSGGGVYVPINPAGLYKLGATYYVGSFMVALGLYPRDSTGLQHKPPTYPDPMKDFRVLTGATTELKAWQALTKAVSSFPDLDSDGLPNVPPPYANLQGRIIRLNSVPTTTSLVPANKTAGDPGFTLTVNGTNFAENSQVMWNGEARATTYLSPTQVSAEITTADLASVGTAAVTVVNPTPGGGTSNAQTFTINAPPAAASTFYFAEGTCRPNFDSYITIQNPGGNDADVTVTYMKGDGTTKFVSLTVPKSSRATVSPRDTLGTGNDAAHDFSAKVECTNGQQITAERPMYFNYNGVWTGGHDVVGATSPASAFYFAEGTCRPNFDPYICVLNPGGSDANVTITYMKGDGTTKSATLTVPKNSRSTVLPRDTLGTGNDAAHDFSAKVECTNGQQIVAERPMYFNYNGIWTGGSDVVGATSPASAFYFAEGTCRPNFDPYVTILNPGANDANVTVTYMKGDGTTATQQVTVPKNARSTVMPRSILGTGNDAAHDFSITVECTNGQKIVAERPMYFNYNGIWTGGHDVVGATAPQTIGWFAEGTCRPNFDPWITIQNPGANDANVTITYMKGDGTTASQQITVPRNARRTIDPRLKLGTGNDAAHDFSVTVECTNGQKIVAERPIYFNYNGVWTGGSCTIGFTP